jgi:hypothetical protein
MDSKPFRVSGVSAPKSGWSWTGKIVESGMRFIVEKTA